MDAIKFAFAFLLVFIPFTIAKFMYGLELWWLCWLSVLVLFVGWELYGTFVSKGKATISRQFWRFKEKQPLLAGLCVLGWLAFSIYLGLHLWFKW